MCSSLSHQNRMWSEQPLTGTPQVRRGGSVPDYHIKPRNGWHQLQRAGRTPAGGLYQDRIPFHQQRASCAWLLLL